jgi:hypothetical protein
MTNSQFLGLITSIRTSTTAEFFINTLIKYVNSYKTCLNFSSDTLSQYLFPELNCTEKMMINMAFSEHILGVNYDS